MACAWLIPGSAAAEDTPGLFEDDSLLEVELTGPVSTTIEDREQRNERPFLLEQDGSKQALQVRVRGNSRSREKLCSFPPLRFRFEDPAGAFAGQDKLKLVSHCRNSDRGDANALEEYAAYRIFNLLSPVSFRTRPLRVTYIDTDGKLTKQARQRYGFLIEPKEQLAMRTGGTLLELEGVSLARLDPRQAALVYVFQYLIGNTDWSLVTGDGSDYCCHNGLLLEIDGRIHYVPYDFDLTGLVNARYAKPDPSLRLRNVRQRRYLGFCTEPEILLAATRSIVEREEDIYTVIRSMPGLSEKQKTSNLDYLGGFFEKAREEEKLLAEFRKRCITN